MLYTEVGFFLCIHQQKNGRELTWLHIKCLPIKFVLSKAFYSRHIVVECQSV